MKDQEGKNQQECKKKKTMNNGKSFKLNASPDFKISDLPKCKVTRNWDGIGIEEEMGNEKRGKERHKIIIRVKCVADFRCLDSPDVEQQETETKLNIKKETSTRR